MKPTVELGPARQTTYELINCLVVKRCSQYVEIRVNECTVLNPVDDCGQSRNLLLMRPLDNGIWQHADGQECFFMQEYATVGSFYSPRPSTDI